MQEVDLSAKGKQQQQQRKKKAPVGTGGVSQYFLLILGAFGLCQFALNLSQSDSHLTHQRDSIAEFKRKHFTKSHSKDRSKRYQEQFKYRQQEQLLLQQEEQDEQEQERELEDKKKALNLKKKKKKKKAKKKKPKEEWDVVEEDVSKLAGLNCKPFGGPSNKAAQEMVYWEDIPSDNDVVSPFHSSQSTQYITFESDLGGWNNIRVSVIVSLLCRAKKITMFFVLCVCFCFTNTRSLSHTHSIRWPWKQCWH